MFVVLVLMAIATTLMTGPLLNLIEKIWPETSKAKVFDAKENTQPTMVVD
jgi:hypothetical protein